MSIIVQNLTKIYGAQKAVDDISFSVQPGEIVGFLGPNGAGKSTTMKILTCFLPQTSGKAEVLGYDVTDNPIEVRRHIGYLPEHNPLYLDMYVREYLQFTAKLHGLKNGVNARVDEIIEKTGITPERKKKIGQLSKGYRQRVGLAQALLHNPEVLILDEPTSGLDPNQITEIRSLIKETGKDRTVMLSTHIMQEVEALCDRVIIINKGKIVADDETQHLKTRLKGGKAIIKVELKGETSETRLKSIPGVTQAKRLNENNWQLLADNPDEIKELLFRFAVENNLVILGLSQETQRLEDVFQQLTK
ncbi:MAG TPA: gliding motility-associated ABC transporter ATP-binding subunit GldA [Bacteroidia bacterium]|nr:gliding motility-associated ABC transporter ATP-binding subunit GldA [Bacteroidia bacterium]